MVLLKRKHNNHLKTYKVKAYGAFINITFKLHRLCATLYFTSVAATQKGKKTSYLSVFNQIT